MVMVLVQMWRSWDNNAKKMAVLQWVNHARIDVHKAYIKQLEATSAGELLP